MQTIGALPTKLSIGNFMIRKLYYSIKVSTSTGNESYDLQMRIHRLLEKRETTSHLLPSGSLDARSNLFWAVIATSFLMAEAECVFPPWAGEQIANRPYSTTWFSRFRVWISLRRPEILKSWKHRDTVRFCCHPTLFLLCNKNNISHQIKASTSQKNGNCTTLLSRI